MTRAGIGLRLLVQALAFLIVIGPHWLSLRFGRGRLAAHIPVLFHRLFLRLFSVRVTQTGTPPPPGEPALVLANHVSWLDIVALGSLRPLSFVAKSEIEGWPLIGPLAKLQRTVFIERAKRAATASVNATVGERLVNGDLIVLFAEGTTGDGLRLLPFRSSLVGAARAALAAEAGGLARIRLQPLALAYPRRNGLPVTRAERPEIAWYGDMDLVPHLGLFAGRGPIDVHVDWGAPIAFDAATDRKVATAQAEAAVRRSLREIRLGGLPPRPAPAAPEMAGEGADVSAPGIAAV
ncbi:MAG TPA: lysophospholipid acyltransferase family protein [Methylobacterium sp.]|jgi:1-acyl-sn-glycerol-3-phosphate acyltransferase|uniref:lysophospholipid acyltransferase family protein n=1 Tax=Methylorubrum sp. B1-46 TaxID=2897334 RepID=UPI001E2C56DE|nr:lysophospholipid acyltransferase family protein [Methylorubrum sp. B1-46]UGB24434.1 1-acyl-sn-glycerol-3-phosphate acyltransferase [Methylorubrum sp. B1-46]HEV2543007.1 lysophospholipid acyltransferase family protein [Methylobacterium sp.]